MPNEPKAMTGAFRIDGRRCRGYLEDNNEWVVHFFDAPEKDAEVISSEVFLNEATPLDDDAQWCMAACRHVFAVKREEAASDGEDWETIQEYHRLSQGGLADAERND